MTYKKSINNEDNDVLTIVIEVNDALSMKASINGQLHTELVGTNPQQLEDEAIKAFEDWRRQKNAVPIELDNWFDVNGYEMVTE